MIDSVTPPAKLSVSVCVPAYNEGGNIAKILDALSAQQTDTISINKIIVISSGSTDNTDDIALSYSEKDNRIILVREKARTGKASAINTFLEMVDDPVVVIESADTVPTETTIEELCRPFMENDSIGMTGGAPFPVNDINTFTGYLVHTWWWFHRNIPRFGEIVAFKNVIPAISSTTAVDEAFIQAKLIQLGFKAVYIDSAVVRNKGPETVSDLIKQRRRIFNGHSRLYHEEGIKIDNMTKSSMGLLWSFKPPTVKHLLWLMGGMSIELFARCLGMYDAHVRKINPFVWDTARTTKKLNLHKQMQTVIDVHNLQQQELP